MYPHCDVVTQPQPAEPDLCLLERAVRPRSLFVGMCIIAAAQTRIVGALRRSTTQKGQLRMQNEVRVAVAAHHGCSRSRRVSCFALALQSMQKALESRDRAQTRARDHKREREALMTKQKAQQKLMGFVCHELRAPLHALKVGVRTVPRHTRRGVTRAVPLPQGIIASIDSAMLPEDVRGDLEFMDVSASQMSLIINDVLDLVTVSASAAGHRTLEGGSSSHGMPCAPSQVQAGHQMSITPAWCDIRKAVRHARMFVDSYVQVPVRVRVHQDVPAQVWLDELRIKQVRVV